MDATLKDLETRGFVVIRSFLSASELDAARADYAHQQTNANRNYKVSLASAEENARLVGRVQEAMDAVTAQTDLRPDTPSGGAYFATGRGVTFSWHQDHESFFATRNHYDYLNFYIPIVKPDPRKSGLCVVPFDVLQRECPRTYQLLYRSGASRFIRLGSRRVVFCDDRGTVHVMPKDVEALAEAPELEAGDLLLMRGDIIHRTQDADTERVALSFRVASRSGLVSRAALADGGLYKARMMANNAGYYDQVFKAFDQAGRDEMTFAELEGVLATIERPAPREPRDFMKLLMQQKRRAHVYARFWPKVVVGAMAARAVTLYERFGARAH
jgi:Phytanoyl-CoA dioxygenase (PhyH)